MPMDDGMFLDDVMPSGLDAPGSLSPNASLPPLEGFDATPGFEDMDIAPSLGENTDTMSHAPGFHASPVAFGSTGDPSFDSLMDRVDQLNAETRQFAELARMETATDLSSTMAPSAGSGGFACNTGDTDLNSLLNRANQAMGEFSTLADQARMGLGPGQYLSIDDAIAQGGSQGLSDFLQQRLDWMDHATPEQLRQFEHQVNWGHETEIARAHEHDLLREQGDLAERFIKHQTEDQFQMEKEGYHQVNPWEPYQGQQGDPNLFEKDGHFFKLDNFGNRYWQSDIGEWHPMH